MARPKRKEREPSDDDEDYREVESKDEEDDRTVQRKKNSKKSLKSKRKKQEEVEDSDTEEEEPSTKKGSKKHSKEKSKKQKVKHIEDSDTEEEPSPKKGSKKHSKVKSKKQKVKHTEDYAEEGEVEEKAEAALKRKRHVKPGHVQYRCTLISFLNTIKDNKKNLSPRTLDLLRQTPFGNIVDAFHGGYIEEKSSKKSDDFITLLLQAYNHEKDLFFFGKKKFKISTRDISKILGLAAKGELVPKTSEGAYQSDFVQQFFPNTARINKRAVEKALQDALKDKPTTEEEVEKKDKNVARLILLDLSIKFLFPNAGGTISWDYVKACENLDKIGSYDWAKEVGNFLKKSIKTLKKKKSNSSYGNTRGCVLIILYWFCQKTGKIKPISGREKEEHEMRKWDIQRLIQNWTSFNSLKKLELKEDGEETESEEEETGSDEEKTASQRKEQGHDDQTSEEEEDNLKADVPEQGATEMIKTSSNKQEKEKWKKQLQKKEEEIRNMTLEKENLEKRLMEKEDKIKQFREDKVNLEEQNATLVMENLCLKSSVEELEAKVKNLEEMLNPKTKVKNLEEMLNPKIHTSSAAQQHRSPPPNSTKEQNESNAAQSKAVENTEKEDQSTIEEGQSQGIFTVEDYAAGAAQSPPHCTVAQESQSTAPSHMDSLFQSPTVPTLTVDEMEKQPAMFQIVKSPMAMSVVPLCTLSLEEEQKTPEQNKKSKLTILVTKQHSGKTVSAMGLYSYVVRLKNKKRTQKKDDIYWWGDVKAKEIEERLKYAEKKEKESYPAHPSTPTF